MSGVIPKSEKHLVEHLAVLRGRAEHDLRARLGAEARE